MDKCKDCCSHVAAIPVTLLPFSLCESQRKASEFNFKSKMYFYVWSSRYLWRLVSNGSFKHSLMFLAQFLRQAFHPALALPVFLEQPLHTGRTQRYSVSTSFVKTGKWLETKLVFNYCQCRCDLETAYSNNLSCVQARSWGAVRLLCKIMGGKMWGPRRMERTRVHILLW